MIFNVEKWERIKNRHDNAVEVYLAASEDFRFEKDSFEKIAGIFTVNFPPSNTQFAEAEEAIRQLRRMNPLDFSAITLKVKETRSLAEQKTSHHQHLVQLLDKLIVMKRAEARKDQASENQQNNTRCFAVLEAFARKHIKLHLSSGPAPVADSIPTMDYYTESSHG